MLRAFNDVLIRNFFEYLKHVVQFTLRQPLARVAHRDANPQTLRFLPRGLVPLYDDTPDVARVLDCVGHQNRDGPLKLWWIALKIASDSRRPHNDVNPFASCKTLERVKSLFHAGREIEWSIGARLGSGVVACDVKKVVNDKDQRFGLLVRLFQFVLGVGFQRLFQRHFQIVDNCIQRCAHLMACQSIHHKELSRSNR